MCLFGVLVVVAMVFNLAMIDRYPSTHTTMILVSLKLQEVNFELKTHLPGNNIITIVKMEPSST
jgi:hypothetical protein